MNHSIGAGLVARLHFDLLACFKAIDPQIWIWAAGVLFVVHFTAMIVIDRFGWKMRAAVADAGTIPKTFFSAGQIARWRIYGFIVFSPRHKGITKMQYAWIRVARFSFLLLMAGGLGYLALAVITNR